jgi:hypothetical protein
MVDPKIEGGKKNRGVERLVQEVDGVTVQFMRVMSETKDENCICTQEKRTACGAGAV